jgi:hypothetical protein
MRCADVVAQLQRRLPLLTDLFSDTVAVSSIVHTGTTAMVTTTSPHGLAVGQAPTIFGARTPVAVASITHAPLATFAVVTTSADHDLTLYRTFADGNVVEVDGANEADFEGLRKVVAVRNRRTIEIEVDAGAPAAATGTIRLLGASSYLRNVRGRYTVVNVPSPTVFTVTHDAASDLGALIGPAVVRTPARITGAFSEAAAGRSYSLEANGAAPKPWAFVILGEQAPVRQREAPAEAIAVNMLSGGWSQYVVQPFRVLVALPSTSDERGRTSRDQAADLLGIVCRALLGAAFPTGFARPTPSTFVQFAGEESQQSEPGPFYLHAYDFQQVAQVGLDDTVQNDEHVAFRDIEVEIGNDVGPSVVAIDVDLDEVPL